MIRILLPVLAMLLAIGCVSLNGHGLESLADPAVVAAILFLVVVGCFPLLRRAFHTVDEMNGALKLRKWLSQRPWLGLLLIWNSLGALMSLYGMLSCILLIQHGIRAPDLPGMLMPVLFWLWFLPMPFTTAVAAVPLWRNRKTVAARVLLLSSAVILAIWSNVIAMFVAFIIPVN